MTHIITKSASLALVLAFGLPTLSAMAQDATSPPPFMQETLPQGAIDGSWAEYQAIMNPEGALDGMTKELIALAVSAQIPCDYCIYFHTKAAMQHGATDEQVKEALASAGLVRKWSTILNGSQYDEAQWQQQVDAMFAGN